jgi:hypothetical protein
MRMSKARPFLEAAAQAMGVERLSVIDTGTEPAGGRDQWDDGSNVLAIGRRTAVCHERNSQTNARLEDAGVRVIRVPSSELGSLRGGPRCMSCPVSRDPAALPDQDRAPVGPDGAARPLYRERLVLAAAEAATGALPPWTDAPGPEVPAPAVPVPAAARVPDSRTGGQPGAQEEELASASLGLPPLAAGRPPADTEYPESPADRQHDQRGDEEHPQHVHDGDDQHDQDDRHGDQREYAKHAYTVRPSVRTRKSEPRYGPRRRGRRLPTRGRRPAI